MPYKSQKQAAYFNMHKKMLEAQGVDVDEWNRASKGKDLPVRSSLASRVKSPAAK